MANVPSSVIGLDLGRFTMKSVLLQRRGSDRFVLSNYALRESGSETSTPEQLAEDVRGILQEMGGSAKHCAVAVTDGDAIIRIIEQPETPVNLLRDALRLNGMLLLNQDCREFVLDCDELPTAPGAAPAPANGAVQQRKYLVGGIPRKSVTQIDEAFQKARTPVSTVQLGAISAFNAFEFAHPEIFNDEAFLLVDIGHVSSTVILGSRRELVLVRSLEYGGNALIDALISHGGGSEEDPMKPVEAGDEAAVEIARMSLSMLTREIGSSVGFLEGQREETIRRVFVSGGPVRSKAILRLLSRELEMPCETWNPFQNCEVALPASRRAAFDADFVNLNIACGAAAELLRPA